MARKRRKNLQARQQQQAAHQKRQAKQQAEKTLSEPEITASTKVTFTETATKDTDAAPSAPPQKRPPYSRLEKLLGAVNTASNAARGSWIGFLGIQAYIFITIAGVSHTSLLLNSNVKLPVVNTQLPLSSFFLFAPLVFLFAHFGFLLPHAMLTRKADTLNREMEHIEKDMPKEDYHPYRNEVVSYFFAQALVGPPPSLLYGVILHLMGWLSFVFFPLFLLLFFQVKFLPYHDAMTTWFHRSYILADMLILFVAYKISLNKVADEKYANYLSLSKISTRLLRYLKQLFLPKADKDYYTLDDDFVKVRQYYKDVSWGKAVKSTALYVPRLLLRTIGRINLFFMAIAFAFFSVCIATFPGECVPWWSIKKNGIQKCEFSHESWLANLWGITIPPKNHQSYNSGEKADLVYRQNRTVFVPTSWFFEKPHKSWFSLDRNLNLINRDFINNKKFPLSKQGEEPSISLRGRNFRHAILDGSDLHFVDFSGADLSYASLERTDLRGAKLEGSSLQNTSLEGAKLQNAQLAQAIFQGAYLGKAWLTNASLEKATLSGAYLGRAHLEGANMKGASLQGAYLGATRMQGADLSEANLQGARLSNARLQGAKLDNANLQGANLQKARLQGASLRFANLQGANFSGTFLQAADLSQANLQYSQNMTTGQLSFTQFQGAKIWSFPVPDKEQLALLSHQASLPLAILLKDSHSYKNDILALKQIIRQDPSIAQRLEATIQKLDSLMLHIKNDKWDGSEGYTVWQGLVGKAKGKAKPASLTSGLTKTLAKLACADKTNQQWIARSLVARILDNSKDHTSPRCFLKRLTAEKCRAGQKLIKNWPNLVEALTEIAKDNKARNHGGC